MMLSIPAILYEDQYKDTWEWDGWKPKAKPDAPSIVKKAIEDFLKDAEDNGSGDYLISL